MKTIKPLRLGLLTRPYRWQRRDVLGVSVFALVDIAQTPTLLTDQELWKLAGAEAGGLLDLATPKLHPEVLLAGHAYPHGNGSPSACAVRLKVGAIDKSLLVFGDRYWLDGKATPPQPFERMRLDWSHAYGGPGHAEESPWASALRTKRSTACACAGCPYRTPAATHHIARPARGAGRLHGPGHGLAAARGAPGPAIRPAMAGA